MTKQSEGGPRLELLVDNDNTIQNFGDALRISRGHLREGNYELAHGILTRYMTSNFEEVGQESNKKNYFYAHAVLSRASKGLARQRDLSVEESRKNEELSLTDHLTELWNRRGMERVAGAFLSNAQRDDEYVHLLMLDLDHFKRLNDTYGHDEGDITLANFSRLLRGSVRGSEVLVRLGGEEFVVIGAGKENDGEYIAGNILKNLRNPQYQISRHEPVTASIGYTQWKPKGIELDKYLKQADDALYHAKRRGRNQAVNYTTIAKK